MVHFLEPYWNLEVFLFKVIAIGAALYLIGWLSLSIKTELKLQREVALEAENTRKVQEGNRKRAEIEEIKRKQETKSKNSFFQVSHTQPS